MLRSSVLLLVVLLQISFILSQTSNLLYQEIQDASGNQKIPLFPESTTCESSDRCKRFPESCSGSECLITVAWNEMDQNGYVTYSIMAKLDLITWTALEFSSNQNHDITETGVCEPLTDIYSQERFVKDRIEKSPSISFLDQDWEENDNSIAASHVALDGEHFYCGFSRRREESKPYVYLSYENSNRDVNRSDRILIHKAIPESSSQMEEVLPVLERSRRAVDDNYTEGCGETKGCFSQYGSLFTYAIYTAADGEEYLQIQLESDPGWAWIAIGFSHDDFMPDTSVVECIQMPDDSILVQHSYNRGYSTPEVIDSRGLNVTEAGIVNGSIKCSFDRKVVYSGAEADPRLFNLTEEYHLILARGPSFIPGVKAKHQDSPVASPLTNLSEFRVTVSPSLDSSMCVSCTAKAHGCLMITAWVFLTSLGIFMPRYFKPYLTEKKIIKTAAWFFVHRVLMLLTWSATAASFIIMFVLHEGKLISFGSSAPSYFSAHAPLGITIMILVTINPIMALFRCAPDHDKRLIFNWLHFIVGTSAQILAVINIFFGIKIAEYSQLIGTTVFWLMIAYVCFHVVIEALLIILKVTTNEKTNVESGALIKQGRAWPNFSLLGIYAVVVTGLWIAMVVLISID